VVSDRAVPTRTTRDAWPMQRQGLRIPGAPAQVEQGALALKDARSHRNGTRRRARRSHGLPASVLGCRTSFWTRQLSTPRRRAVLDGQAISWIQPNCFSCLRIREHASHLSVRIGLNTRPGTRRRRRAPGRPGVMHTVQGAPGICVFGPPPARSSQVRQVADRRTRRLRVVRHSIVN